MLFDHDDTLDHIFTDKDMFPGDHLAKALEGLDSDDIIALCREAPATSYGSTELCLIPMGSSEGVAGEQRKPPHQYSQLDSTPGPPPIFCDGTEFCGRFGPRNGKTRYATDSEARLKWKGDQRRVFLSLRLQVDAGRVDSYTSAEIRTRMHQPGYMSKILRSWVAQFDAHAIDMEPSGESDIGVFDLSGASADCGSLVSEERNGMKTFIAEDAYRSVTTIVNHGTALHGTFIVIFELDVPDNIDYIVFMYEFKLCRQGRFYEVDEEGLSRLLSRPLPANENKGDRGDQSVAN